MRLSKIAVVTILLVGLIQSSPLMSDNSGDSSTESSNELSDQEENKDKVVSINENTFKATYNSSWSRNVAKSGVNNLAKNYCESLGKEFVLRSARTDYTFFNHIGIVVFSCFDYDDMSRKANAARVRQDLIIDRNQLNRLREDELAQEEKKISVEKEKIRAIENQTRVIDRQQPSSTHSSRTTTRCSQDGDIINCTTY